MGKSFDGKAIYYIFLISIHIGLVWILPYFPTQDGPSHVYNLVILHDLLNGGKVWGNFFEYQLHAAPNLGFHIVAYPWMQFFPPWAVERIFLSIYIALIAISVPVFLRTFGRPFLPGSFFVFPIIFNYTLLMGFYSYVVAVPLFLLAFSLAWKIRSRSAVCKFIYYNLAGLLLYYFHLIPFIFFLMSLFAITIAESTGFKNILPNLVRLCLIILPLILNLFFYLASGTNDSLVDPSQPSRQNVAYLLKDLLFFSSVSLSPWQVAPASLYMSLIVLCSYLSLKNILLAGWRIEQCAPATKTLVLLASSLIFIYFFVPFRFGEGSFFNQRFPWVILLVLLPLLDSQEKHLSNRFVSITFAGGAGIFFIVNALLFSQQSAAVEKYLSGLRAGIPQGAFVMTYKTQAPEWSRIDVLMHAASYYGVYGGCVDVGDYEASLHFHYFPVHFRNPLSAIPSSEQIDYKPATINWPDYPSVQYLIGWEINSRETKRLAEFFHVIWLDGPLSIWQKNPSKFSRLCVTESGVDHQ